MRPTELLGADAKLTHPSIPLLQLDYEFWLVRRGARVVRLKGQELKVMAALMTSDGPIYVEALLGASGVSPRSVYRAIFYLRKKLEPFDVKILTVWGRGGRTAYVLSDKAASEAA